MVISCLHGSKSILNVLSNEAPEELLYISIPITFIHLFLLFSNGDPSKMKQLNVEAPEIIHKQIQESQRESIQADVDNTDPNKDIFNAKAKEIFTQFESDLNAENFKDYPVPYWYDIVKGRAESMKSGSGQKSIVDVQKEWTWMHADEYTSKYQSISKKDSIQAISLRIARFGFIYQKLCTLENRLHDLAREYNLKINPFSAQFDWDKASAAASLYGSINFALS